MTLEEFYEDAEFEVQSKTPISSNLSAVRVVPPIVVGELIDDGLDEVLPPDIVKAYVGGEITYLKVTEDGRKVRIDDWLMGVV